MRNVNPRFAVITGALCVQSEVMYIPVGNCRDVYGDDEHTSNFNRLLRRTGGVCETILHYTEYMCWSEPVLA